jgi:hypothetical protein
MISLYFVPAKFPRSITRGEWREIWRWKRVTQKKLVEAIEEERQMLITYGSTMLPQAKADLIEHMVNPPLLVHDRMKI